MAPDRFASAAEFAAALQPEGAGTVTRFASAEKARGTAQTRGLRVALGAVAALAMIAMVAAVWGWQRPIAPRSEMVAQFELAAPPGLTHAFREAIGLLAVSPDGRMMTFAVKTTSGVALAVRSLDQLAARVLPGTSAALYPAFSPDGRWMAYVSDESGRNEVYVRPLAPRGGRVTVSSGGGGEPRWSRDGRRLFYRAGSTLMVADIATTPQLAVGARMVLFEGPFETDGLHPNYDVLADGSGFIMLRTNEESWRLVLVINWAAELRQRLGGGK